jgi:hypothetical protein
MEVDQVTQLLTPTRERTRVVDGREPIPATQRSPSTFND